MIDRTMSLSWIVFLRRPRLLHNLYLIQSYPIPTNKVKSLPKTPSIHYSQYPLPVPKPKPAHCASPMIVQFIKKEKK